MDKNELLEYLNTNSSVITTFKDKVRDDLNVKNKKRQPAKRWNDAHIERQVDKLTDTFISNIFDKLYRGMKATRTTPREQWIRFIDENEILDSLEESVSMLELGED